MEAPVVPLMATTSPRETFWPTLTRGRGQVVVRGLQAVAVVDDHAVSAAVRVPAIEGHGAAGGGMDAGAALGGVILAAVELPRDRR